MIKKINKEVGGDLISQSRSEPSLPRSEILIRHKLAETIKEVMERVLLLNSLRLLYISSTSCRKRECFVILYIQVSYSFCSGTKELKVIITWRFCNSTNSFVSRVVFFSRFSSEYISILLPPMPYHKRNITNNNYCRTLN